MKVSTTGWGMVLYLWTSLCQVHTSTKAWKGTCIYYGVILILVQGEEEEEKSASSEEDHTGLAYYWRESC